MVDPATAIAVVKFAADLFGMNARSRAEARGRRLANGLRAEQLNNVTRPEFNKRVAAARTGNDLQYALSAQGGDEVDAFERDDAADLLGEDAASFDEQLALSVGLDADQVAFANQVVDKYQVARLENTNRYVAAQFAQDMAQAEADALADAFNATRGQVPFDAVRDAAETDRNALTSATVTGPLTGLTTPPGSNNPTIAAAFAREQTRGVNEATGDLTRQNKVLASGDAVLDRERGLKMFSEGVDRIGVNSRLDAAPVAAQNFAMNLRARNDAAGIQGDADLGAQLAERLSKSMGDNRDKRLGARADFGADRLATTGTYYDNTLGAESDFTSRVVDASRAYEQGMSGLYDMKMNSIGQTGGGFWSSLSAGLDGVSGLSRLRRGSVTKPRTRTVIATGQKPPGQLGTGPL